MILEQILNNVLETIDTMGKDSLSKSDVEFILRKEFSKAEDSPGARGDISSKGVHLCPKTYVCKTSSGVSITLPRKEFDLMYYLIKNKNRVVSRSEILSNIWERGVMVGHRTIDVHVAKINRKIANKYIQSRKCFGYIWREE